MAPTCNQLLVIFLSQILATTGLHILVMPLNIGSHVVTFGRTAELLLEKGHNVTFLISNTQRIPKSVKDIPMEFVFYKLKKEPLLQSAKHRDDAINNALNGSILNSYTLLFEEFEEFISECEEMLADTDLYIHLEKQKFDIVVSDMFTCPLILMYKLNIPFTLLGSDCLSTVMRIPAPPSYLPRNWHPLPFSDKMNFLERVFNFFVFSLDHLLLQDSAKLVHKYVPHREPISELDIYKQLKLCFKIKPSILDFVRPTTPNVIPLGNLMTRPAGTLPKDLLDFVSEAEHGVIVMCFGSWMTSLPYATALKFFEAFSQIEQRVIWKYHGKIPNNAPANVKVSKWLPQNDLLGHSNIRLFIYHGGTAGTVESVYHGVPMIIFPLFIDQIQNAAIVESKHYGTQLSIASFTADELVSVIKKVLSETSYKETVKAASAVMRDEFTSAADTLDYWLKHVLKHGAKHLRVHALEMPLYQVYSLDVICVLLFIICVICVIIYKIFITCCRCICKQNTMKEKYE